MQFLLSLCVLLSLIGLSEEWASRRKSLGGSGRSRFAAFLKNRKSSLFGNRARGVGSIFASLSSKVRKPTCHFDQKGVPQYGWPTKNKLCFDKRIPYPTESVFRALENDFDAQEYMLLIQNGYVNEAMNRTGMYGGVRYKDLCSEKGRLLERIWWPTHRSVEPEVCYVIMPEEQGVYVPRGGGNCVMDKTEVKHHYCVPDGFVDREIYVFCPGEMKQCRRTSITVPTGCSCKKYDCLKYEMV